MLFGADNPPLRLPDIEAAQALFAPLAGERVEVMAFAYLDRAQQVLGMRHARSARRDQLSLPIRDIAADAIAFHAFAVVMAHNHPSGDPTPSRADREATDRLARALDTLGVRLLDHLVVAANGITSFRSLGFL
ncbi:DNA repair protein RadC [Sphingomonas kyeonggiensis]|uniref:DNA repair protein RadC n=1 Tax=Sphingomonas kyeonggiensis TaxID=1268553 RepID=A0A7W7NPY2_9SPHN|nr:JAB domain-containing protein [Sphingomonas kyeonggiensis]MBB4837560.1 DNA repair protein RadC [Sphingomonas kyeonggiensis]